MAMMEPFKETSEEAAQAMFTRQLTELFDSESKDETECVKIPQELSDFLTLSTKGPKLDETTVRSCMRMVSAEYGLFCSICSNPFGM
jgi:hypothetical protein